VESNKEHGLGRPDIKLTDYRNRRVLIIEAKKSDRADKMEHDCEEALQQITDRLLAKYPNIKVKIHAVRNDFFGEMITVAGLLTGQDLIAQLKGNLTSEELLVPDVMLRDGEEVFLDDITIKELSEALQIKVTVVKSGGQDLVNAILGDD